MSDLTGNGTGLPTSEDTRAKYKVFVEKVHQDVVVVLNASGSEIKQGDFVVAGNTAGASGQKVWCGVARQDIPDGESGAIDVEEGILCQASDLVAAEDAFATYGQNVFYDASTGEFSDTSTAGYWLVGLLYVVKDSDGVIKFEKFRYGELV